MEFLDQPLIRLRFLDRVQISALYIFDQCDLHGLLLIIFTDHHRDLGKSGQLGRSPPALPGYDLIMTVLFLDDQRLKHSIRLNGICQLLERSLIKIFTGLCPIGFDQ